MKTFINMENKNTQININRPKLLWIDSKHCFRTLYEIPTYKNTGQSDRNSKTPNRKNLAPYNDNEEFDEPLDCLNASGPEIEATENGRYRTSIHIPQYYFRYIIGAKGSKRKKIEDETKSSIKIPNSTKENDPIKISGPTERSIISAIDRIQMIVNEIKDKHEATHFISIPMNSPLIQKNFEEFKRDILYGNPIRGIDDSIFQKPKKLHLTIGVMVLLDDYEKTLAVKLLEECKDLILRPTLQGLSGYLKIRMYGIEYMNDDPENVDVLYAKVEVTNKKYLNALQTMSDKIVDLFSKKGLMKRQYHKVKLHVTLINSRYRTDETEEGNSNADKKRKPKRRPFDATDIMKKYANYEFGEMNLESLHLSIRFNVAESGFYESLSAVTTLI